MKKRSANHEPQTQTLDFPTIESDVDLTTLNTLGVKSVAAKFVEIRNRVQLEALSERGFFKKEKPFILGGGSNILLKGNPSVPVLKVSVMGVHIVKESDTGIWIRAGGGENWHDLVTWAVERGFGGIENLALIPGTVGAAPIQNIGAYGVELEEVFEKLEAFDLTQEAFKTFHRSDCQFAYRDSIFKRELRGRIVVTDVILRLRKAPHKITADYYALQNYFEQHGIQNPGIEELYKAVIAIRRSKLPDPSLLGNAGSFFKNPVVEKSLLELLIQEYSDIPSFPAHDGTVKIPAGWLIEQAGWKGKRFGKVGTYENQALVIVNHGGATGEEIFAHAQRIQKSVKARFGIELVPEVNIVDG